MWRGAGGDKVLNPGTAAVLFAGQLGKPQLYRGALDCARQIYRGGGGVGVFYKGLLVNAMKRSPGSRAAIGLAANSWES